MEKITYHEKQSANSGLMQTIVGTILYIAVMAAGISFFVRLLTM